ncbi:MAG: hypothetical protein AB7N91_03150 [Candidatus Tectimicrobiota bacterium]
MRRRTIESFSGATTIAHSRTTSQSRVQAFQRHLARLDRRLDRLHTLSRLYARGRAGTVLLGLAMTVLAEQLINTVYGLLMAGLFILAFSVLVSCHNRVKARLLRTTIWRRLKTVHLARLRRDWAHLPAATPVADDAEHPFAADVNLTGERSLLHLLDTTTSRGGSARLRTWFVQPTLDSTEIQSRQAMVRELLPLAAFRDHLALAGALVARDPDARWEEERVLTWLHQQPAHAAVGAWVLGLGLLAATNLTLITLYGIGLLPAWWTLSFPLYLLLYMYKHGAAHDLFVEAYQLEQALHHLRAVLLYLETRRYSGTPRLAALCAPFWQAVRRPSTALKRIARIAGAAGVQQSNILGMLVNALVPWDLYFAHRLNQYRGDIQTDLPVWIETWYELEALNALANFGYLHPEYVFPEIRPVSQPAPQPVLRASALGHPLLPQETRVCNDFAFAHLGEIVLITGSNMSGKSTFLRTLGINLCLAYAGAPVNATAMQTMPLRLFTCIKVSDSVTDGISYFYAEVRRLKALLQALTAREPVPLCFLIDEIFRGTNNRERLLGSRSYIQALASGHGVGLISTHDLELVTLADTLPGLRNAHFREDVQSGRMVFDYHLRSGPCPTTNALKIMQMEGLPVEPAALEVPTS